MRARLAFALRTLADRLVGHSEADALRLDVRRLEQDVTHWKRRAEGEAASCEWYIAERDRLERQLSAARGEAASWLRVAGDQSRLMIELAAARDAAARPTLSAPLGAVVVRPVFGRRRPAAPTLPGPAA